MNEFSPEALTTQLNSLLKAYSAAASDAGIATPISVNTENQLAITGDMANSLGSLANLTSLNSLTQIPTSFTGIVDMLPKTGMFSMESMIWSTVGTFVFLWLLWYSKERAKAKLWARTFHKEAKKFMKEYREEELEHQKELRKTIASTVPDLPAALQVPQDNTRPDMSNLLTIGIIKAKNPIPQPAPTIETAPPAPSPFHI